MTVALVRSYWLGYVLLNCHKFQTPKPQPQANANTAQPSPSPKPSTPTNTGFQLNPVIPAKAGTPF